MIDTLFQESVYYLFMNNDIVLLSVGITSFVVFFVSLLTLLKKWGDSY